MRITIDTSDKVEVAGDKRAVSPGEPAAEQATVVDAGPAPVDLIRRSRPVSLDANAIDAGPTRLSVALPKSEQEMPLNPLRAGAAAATGGMQVREAAASRGEEARAPASADMEGGSAPTSAAGEKLPSAGPGRRGRAARGRKAKR